MLAGTRILVTAQRRANDLSLALARRGAEVITAASLGVESHIDEDDAAGADPHDDRHRRGRHRHHDGIGFRGWLETAETAGLGHDLIEALRTSGSWRADPRRAVRSRPPV